MDFKRGMAIFFDVIAESEDHKGILSSILPVTDNPVFLWYYFEMLQVNNALCSRIYQWDRPHQISEDIYEDRGFWDTKYRNLKKKTILA